MRTWYRVRCWFGFHLAFLDIRPAPRLQLACAFCPWRSPGLDVRGHRGLRFRRRLARDRAENARLMGVA